MSNELELIKSKVLSVKGKWETVPGGLDFEKESFYAIQAMQKNEYLQKSLVQAPETVQAAIFNIQASGLSLNPALGYCFLVPRSNKGRVECILDISYRGMIYLMTSTGGARNVYAYIVYEGDEFEVEQGTEPRILHKPTYTSPNIKAVYGVVVLADGTKQFEVMPISEINDIMQRSEMGKKGVGAWKSDKGEMARKTVIKRLSKYVSKNDRMLQAMEAIQYDHDVNGIDFAEEKKRQRNLKSKNAVATLVTNLTKPAQIEAPTEELSHREELTPSEALKLIESEAGNMNTTEELLAYEKQLELDTVDEPGKSKIKSILDARLSVINSKKK